MWYIDTELKYNNTNIAINMLPQTKCSLYHFYLSMLCSSNAPNFILNSAVMVDICCCPGFLQ